MQIVILLTENFFFQTQSSSQPEIHISLAMEKVGRKMTNFNLICNLFGKIIIKIIGNGVMVSILKMLVVFSSIFIS